MGSRAIETRLHAFRARKKPSCERTRPPHPYYARPIRRQFSGSASLFTCQFFDAPTRDFDARRIPLSPSPSSLFPFSLGDDRTQPRRWTHPRPSDRTRRPNRRQSRRKRTQSTRWSLHISLTLPLLRGRRYRRKRSRASTTTRKRPTMAPQRSARPSSAFPTCTLRRPQRFRAWFDK